MLQKRESWPSAGKGTLSTAADWSVLLVTNSQSGVMLLVITVSRAISTTRQRPRRDGKAKLCARSPPYCSTQIYSSVFLVAEWLFSMPIKLMDRHKAVLLCGPNRVSDPLLFQLQGTKSLAANKLPSCLLLSIAGGSDFEQGGPRAITLQSIS